MTGHMGGNALKIVVVTQLHISLVSYTKPVGTWQVTITDNL